MNAHCCTRHWIRPTLNPLRWVCCPREQRCSTRRIAGGVVGRGLHYIRTFPCDSCLFSVFLYCVEHGNCGFEATGQRLAVFGWSGCCRGCSPQVLFFTMRLATARVAFQFFYLAVMTNPIVVNSPQLSIAYLEAIASARCRPFNHERCRSDAHPHMRRLMSRHVLIMEKIIKKSFPAYSSVH